MSIDQGPQGKTVLRGEAADVLEPSLNRHRPVNPLYRTAVDQRTYCFRNMLMSVSRALGSTDERSLGCIQKNFWEQDKTFKFSPEDFFVDTRLLA